MTAIDEEKPGSFRRTQKYKFIKLFFLSTRERWIFYIAYLREKIS